MPEWHLFDYKWVNMPFRHSDPPGFCSSLIACFAIKSQRMAEENITMIKLKQIILLHQNGGNYGQITTERNI
jgi:hypothetical protein